MRSLSTRTRRWLLAVAAVALLALVVAPAAGAKALKKGTVEGIVLSQTGKPVAGVTVAPLAWSSAGAEWWTWEVVPGVRAVTGKNGSYKLSLPAGKYRISFVPADLRTYAIEAYPDMPAPDFGDDVVVKWGAATRRISAILDPPAHIEGTVRDAATADADYPGDPVEGIHLKCIFQGTARIQTLIADAAISDEQGHYEVWGLKPYAGFALQPPDRPDDAYFGPWFQSTGDFSVTAAYPAGVRYDDILVESNDMVKIDGYVMLADFENQSDPPTPLAGATVRLHELWDDGGWDDEPVDPKWITTTDSTGHFQYAGLQFTGSVLVEVVGTNDYYAVWYPGNEDAWSAQSVEIALGQTENLDNYLVTGSRNYDPPWMW